MNREHILDVLAAYTGSPETMQRVVAVLTEEFGEDWTEVVFTELADIPDDLQHKLKHAFSYYAASAAWNEVQEYLSQTEPLNLEEMDTRWPILGRWLEFFGDEGTRLLDELKQKILAQQQGVEFIPSEEITGKEGPVKDISPKEDEGDETSEGPWEPEEMRSFEKGKVLKSREIEEELREADKEEEPAEPEPVPDTAEAFAVRKVIAQVELLKAAQSWLSSRCVELHNIEVYAYPFYGFIVDLLRQTLKAMESVEGEDYVSLLDRLYPEGKAAFDRQKEAIQNDVSLAEQNCESAVTTLISADMDMDMVRQTLGAIDESGTVEYLGPAPDGFEVLDMDTPLDENAIKEQYAKIEGKNIPVNGEDAGNSSDSKKDGKQNASQSEKNGVQKKLSFSLKNKKPTGGSS